ncbi:MAG: nitronate monooxygenase [Acetobacterales bacterium]
MADVDLSVSIGGLSLAHPLILASGPLSVTEDQLVSFGQVAGAIVAKSTSEKPSQGSPQPRIVAIDHDGMLNYEGGPNPGIDAFADIMRRSLPQMRCPIIGSMSARTLRLQKGMERVAAQFEDAGAAALELDFKYLYDQASLRSDFSLEQIGETIGALRRIVSIPLIAKLAFGPTDITVLAKAAEDAGAAAITAINTVFPGMKISIRRRMPMLSMKYGGLSGAPIRPLAVACVYQITDAVKIPVIASGGAMTGDDVVEFLMAGASAVQIYTVAMAEKQAAFTRVNDELSAWMRDNGAARVSDLVGVVPKQIEPKRKDQQWSAFVDETE